METEISPEYTLNFTAQSSFWKMRFNVSLIGVFIGGQQVKKTAAMTGAAVNVNDSEAGEPATCCYAEIKFFKKQD